MDSESFVTENFLLASREPTSVSLGGKSQSPKRRTTT